MANWVNIKTTSYNGSDAGYDQKLKVTLQYDKDRTTPISTVVRFYTYVGNPMKDGYYILWDPGKSTERLLKGKKQDTYSKDNYSTEFTITKKYSEEIYTIPPYWICHCGAVTPVGLDEIGVASHIINYKTKDEQTVYNYFTNSRKNYKTVVSSVDFDVKEVENAVATSIKVGTTTIKDNGNNTFTIIATKGANGTNNSASGPTNLKWGYTSSYEQGAYTNNSTIKLAIDGYKDSRTIYATSTTEATYGEDKVASTNTAVKQYFLPQPPGTPKISYSRSRLTLKENWKFTWQAAASLNSTTSPVLGYRIKLYKNGVTVKGLKATVITEGYKLSVDSNLANEWIDLSNTTSIILNPIDFQFVAGDNVKISVASYNTWGNGISNYSTSIESISYEVQNAGVVKVKVNNKWKEGQVWVKVGGKWREAETVKIKTANGWKESE